MVRRNGGGGNDDRFRDLYAKYYGRVVRYFMRVFRVEEEDAEDLTQDTFVRFFEALDDYRGDAEWAFIETVARNVGYNRVRYLGTAKRSAKPVPIDDPLVRKQEPQAPAGRDYAEREHDAWRLERLRAAMAALSRAQRETLQLWLADYTYDEIARTLRISMDAVKSRLRDAKKALREKLGDDGGLPEEEE